MTSPPPSRTEAPTSTAATSMPVNGSVPELAVVASAGLVLLSETAPVEGAVVVGAGVVPWFVGVGEVVVFEVVVQVFWE